MMTRKFVEEIINVKIFVSHVNDQQRETSKVEDFDNQVGRNNQMGS